MTYSVDVSFSHVVAVDVLHVIEFLLTVSVDKGFSRSNGHWPSQLACALPTPLLVREVNGAHEKLLCWTRTSTEAGRAQIPR